MFVSRTLILPAYKPGLKKYSELNRLPTAAGYFPIIIILVNFLTVSDEANFKTRISDAESFGRHESLEMPATCKI